jgi:DoxX-like family
MKSKPANGVSVPKKNVRTGWILTGLVTAILLASGTAKLTGAQKMVDGLVHAGIPRTAIVPIAILELTCVALFVIPRTAILGTLLLTGYFGGATVTHIIGRESVVPPLLIGLAIWTGVYLRTPQLQQLFGFGKGENMQGLKTFAPWVNRVVLIGAILIFTTIGLRYIADPVQAAAATGVMLGPGAAATTMRIGFGAFPLAFAIFCFVSLLSTHRLQTGVRLVLTVVGTAIVVRILSMAIDGPAPQSVRLFIPEGIMLFLGIAGLVLESARLKGRPEERI